jgi:hypothetical protein
MPRGGMPGAPRSEQQVGVAHRRRMVLPFQRQPDSRIGAAAPSSSASIRIRCCRCGAVLSSKDASSESRLTPAELRVWC